MITDYDAWSDTPVNTRAVLELLRKNTERTKKILLDLVRNIPAKRDTCKCSSALDGAVI
jgi:hypothetical protein